MDRFYNEDPENEKPFFGSYKDDDNDDDDDDDDDDYDDLEQETIAFIQSPDLVQVMQVGLAQDELTHKIIKMAVKIAKNHWLWRFKSATSKSKEITIVYQSLVMMTENLE